MDRLAWLTICIAALLAALAAACDPAPEQPPAAAPEPTGFASTGAGASPTVQAQQEELKLIVVSSDLAVGPNRFSFVILDASNEPVRLPQLPVAFVSLGEGGQQVTKQATAEFRTWPTGPAGVFAVNVTFERDGPWGVVSQLTRGEGTTFTAQSAFTVNAQSASPGIGSRPPASRNRTAADVSSLKEISSSIAPDPDLYQSRIGDALDSGKPSVVTFATPAFCQTASCGPQVDVLSAVKGRHVGDANFIHVEVYENPDEMQSDITKGRLSPTFDEWGLRSEPFTFVMDRQGKVAAKFEGFVGEDELDAAVVKVLGQ